MRYWYWPGWKGGNTRNRVGKGDKVLILVDYLGSQKVGEGGELCPFHILVAGLRNACLLVLEDTNRAPRV